MQTYDTIDWGAEAARVARAFDIGVPVEFSQSRYGRHLRETSTDDAPRLEGGTVCLVTYSESSRSFAVGGNGARADMELLWNAKVQSHVIWGEQPKEILLAKALFHLELLTPEIEALLSVNISSHEKIEWAMEYQDREG